MYIMSQPYLFHLHDSQGMSTVHVSSYIYIFFFYTYYYKYKKNCSSSPSSLLARIPPVLCLHSPCSMFAQIISGFTSSFQAQLELHTTYVKVVLVCYIAGLKPTINLYGQARFESLRLEWSSHPAQAVCAVNACVVTFRFTESLEFFSRCCLHMTATCESWARSSGSNPIWSCGEMFHCCDTTQTWGLFMLATVQLSPAVCVCVRTQCYIRCHWTYAPSHLLVSQVVECRVWWASEDFSGCLPQVTQRAGSQEPASATYTDSSVTRHKYMFSNSKCTRAVNRMLWCQ